MKKIALLLLTVTALAATSCSNKGNYSCYCVGPDGTVISEVSYTGYKETLKSAQEKCAAEENTWQGTNRNAATRCGLR